jgi:hypothetical protein
MLSCPIRRFPQPVKTPVLTDLSAKVAPYSVHQEVTKRTLKRQNDKEVTFLDDRLQLP